jgi:hypothetical protein
MFRREGEVFRLGTAMKSLLGLEIAVLRSRKRLIRPKRVRPVKPGLMGESARECKQIGAWG